MIKLFKKYNSKEAINKVKKKLKPGPEGVQINPKTNKYFPRQPNRKGKKRNVYSPNSTN